ncbi:MAG: DUF420 domain-containing protein [Bacteroidota bacterium]|nr:DUF420 domain-containing protein [Bacteroidota bacterium]MDP4232611.1 DUF420 domain-containing protein [Bacteroidota bacterium]MDP4242935.1 DUF420 domain-containing protein [Bacteroidota bacterium]MDP4286490.1 DUF420 domain-containing protein [Bacteroidota bacterium]
MTISDLPALNATLNGTSAVLLLVAHNRIKHGAIQQHRSLMIAAFTTSILFLISYLTYHFNAGVLHFGGTGIIRPMYFTLLTTHTILAAAVPVLATITLIFGLRGRYEKHRKIARWTYPIWLYVSATGVIIYFLLYQIYPTG